VTFAIAGNFHAAALVWPQIAEPAPAWKHALFIGVNGVMSVGFALRPRWIVFVFAALTLEQLWSHGSYALGTWRAEGRVDWASTFVLVSMPLMLALLARDAFKRSPVRREAQ
jgi:hypothetical protein